MIHDVPLSASSVHGYFSCDLEPVLKISSGDTIVLSTLEAGWGLEQFREDGKPRQEFGRREPSLETGHPLVGPFAVEGSYAGGTLAIHIEEIRVGTFGWTSAGGIHTAWTERIGVAMLDEHRLRWAVNADRTLARDQYGREVTLEPFLGVVGMPPPEPGIHSTIPPRIWGGNLDCRELVVGSTLFLPIPVTGALISFGDGHLRQGDGEVSLLAIEAPFERVRVTVDVCREMAVRTPVIRAPDAWVTIGLDDELEEAAALAVDAMLALMRHEYGLERRDALALASVVVDLRITQIVNGVKGVHAVLPDWAIRFTR